MLEKFVHILRDRLQKERAKTLLENGRSRGIPAERRLALVEKVLTIEWVQAEINEILKLREEDVDDDDATGVDNDSEGPPPRRLPNARGWGG